MMLQSCWAVRLESKAQRRNDTDGVQSVIDELRRYAVGWMNYFGISHTSRGVLELDDWIRRRVRLYYWTALPRQRHPMGEAKPQSPTKEV